MQFESKLEELCRRREVVDDDADVLHPLNRHLLHGTESVRAAAKGARVETRLCNDKSAYQLESRELPVWRIGDVVESLHRPGHTVSVGDDLQTCV